MKNKIEIKLGPRRIIRESNCYDSAAFVSHRPKICRKLARNCCASESSGIASSAHTQWGNVLFTCSLRSAMSLATCSRFFRPCLGRIGPALTSPRLSGCRLFSSLEKRSNFVASRLSARHASGGSKDLTALLSENALLVAGFGLLGGSLAYVSIILTLSFFQWLYFTLKFSYPFSELPGLIRSLDWFHSLPRNIYYGEGY